MVGSRISSRNENKISRKNCTEWGENHLSNRVLTLTVIWRLWLKIPQPHTRKWKIFKSKVFIESVPTAVIMTYIMSDGGGGKYLLINTIYFWTFYLKGRTDPILKENIGSNQTFFYITFTISALSASLGLAKALKVGVARVVGSDGPFDGLCSAKFLVAFLGYYVFC